MTKRRGKRRSRRERREERTPSTRRDSDTELALALQRAERWIDRDRPERAVDVLEPFTASTPHSPVLFHLLGYARALSGDLWGGLSAFKEAYRLDDDPSYLLSMASVYLEFGQSMHALRVFRQAIESGLSGPLQRKVRRSAAALKRDLADTAESLDRPVDEVEQGLIDLEIGRRALSEEDFPAAIAANRRAVDRLGDWPPPHNNLSQALFYDGRPEEALAEVRGVLANHPQNLSALGNGIRYLAWTGREDEARELWTRLKGIAPRSESERLSKSEAAAVLAEHESVYEVLKPLVDTDAGEMLPAGDLRQAQYLLGVAAANMGRRREAERHLEAVQTFHPSAAETLAALRAGESGTGWADHFRYFHLLDLLPPAALDEILDLKVREDDTSGERFRRRVKRSAQRFPQIVRVAEKMIWEERQPEAGVDMLMTIGTPDAYAALRRFGMSQAGDDQTRAEALGALVEAGEIAEGERIRIWMDGAWREVELQLSYEPQGMMRESTYAPQTIETLNRAFTALQHGATEQAERLLNRALELDPDVKEAYNNLGTIYAKRGEHERARKMFRKAVEIDPGYIYPLSNLVNYLLNEQRIEEAEALLEPATTASYRIPHEIALRDFVRARILMEQEDFEGAREYVESALEAEPGYEPAQDLLDWLDARPDWSYWERQWERDLAWRRRLQNEVTALRPTLAETLPLYTKAALTGMANEVIPRGGWSALRKAELVDLLIETLTNPASLERIVDGLSAREREALRTVLDQGGAMAWDAFDARYDNDLDESRYWEYHVPESTMGQLRFHGLMAEATVDGELYVVVPVDLRESLEAVLP